MKIKLMDAPKIGTKIGDFEVFSDPYTHTSGSYRLIDLKYSYSNDILIIISTKLSRLKSCEYTRIPGKFMENKYIYRAASNILTRCNSATASNYHNYGGRGIKCNLGDTRPKVYFKLLQIPGWVKGSSIDRIDVEGDYDLHNIRWATPNQQAQNRRTNSTFPGVHFNSKTNSWVSKLTQHSKTFRKSFSKIKHGEQALLFAIENRAILRMLYGA